MSNTPRAKTTPTPIFADPGKRATTKKDWIPFQIGDVTFHMVMPKQYDIGQIMMAIDTDSGLDSETNVKAMLRFAGRMSRYLVKEPPVDGQLRGRDLIEYRLADPDDNFDLIHLVPIMMELIQGFVTRPTGSPRASTAPRRAPSAARGSAARTRSTRART